LYKLALFCYPTNSKAWNELRLFSVVPCPIVGQDKTSFNLVLGYCKSNKIKTMKKFYPTRFAKFLNISILLDSGAYENTRALQRDTNKAFSPKFSDSEPPRSIHPAKHHQVGRLCTHPYCIRSIPFPDSAPYSQLVQELSPESAHGHGFHQRIQNSRSSAKRITRGDP